jgi:phage gp36-like protein
MSLAISTKANLEKRIIESRLKLWADKDRDTAIDNATIQEALDYGGGIVRENLSRRYGDLAIYPKTLIQYADLISIYWLASTTQTTSPSVVDAYNKAIQELELISNGSIDIVDDNGEPIPESSQYYMPSKSDTDEDEKVFPRDYEATAPQIAGGWNRYEAY